MEIRAEEDAGDSFWKKERKVRFEKIFTLPTAHYEDDRHRDHQEDDPEEDDPGHQTSCKGNVDFGEKF